MAVALTVSIMETQINRLAIATDYLDESDLADLANETDSDNGSNLCAAALLLAKYRIEDAITYGAD